MKKLLYLHIGEPKCASTALQEYFRLGATSLLQRGIVYPFSHTGPQKIASGNLSGIKSITDVHGRLLKAINQYPDSNLLFSHEALLKHLSNSNHLSATQQLVQSLGFELHLIWIVRNDLELLPSVVNQRSKKVRPNENPLVFSIEDIAQLGITRYQRRIRMIEKVHAQAVPYHLFNLASPEPIQRLVFNAIGATPPPALEIPRINRSLSVDEYVLITTMRHLDDRAKNLADSLTLAALEKPPFKLGFTPDEKQFLWNALNPLRVEFNKHIPPEGRIDSIGTNDPMKEGSISLEQLNQLILPEEQIKRFKTWHNSIYIRKNEVLTYALAALKRRILRTLRLKA